MPTNDSRPRRVWTRVIALTVLAMMLTGCSTWEALVAALVGPK